jgi:hypothetical protein
MTTNELMKWNNRILRELKVRARNFNLTITVVDSGRFIIKASGIRRKEREIRNEFEKYGVGNTFYHNDKSDEISFYFEDDRDARDCEFYLDKVIFYLKQTCC